MKASYSLASSLPACLATVIAVTASGRMRTPVGRPGLILEARTIAKTHRFVVPSDDPDELERRPRITRKTYRILTLGVKATGKTSRILAGRYIDRLEKRNGTWGIVVRRATVEVVLEGTAKMMEALRKGHYLKGGRDKDDLTYVRPLGLEGGPRW